MARPNAVRSIVAILGAAASSCQGMLGGVDVIPASQSPEQTSGPVATPAAQPQRSVPGSMPAGGALGVPIGDPAFGEVVPPLDLGTRPSVDVGNMDVELDAGPPPSSARPIVVDGPPFELPRVGVDGGQPRLGTCQGGVVIGLRPTANPSEEIYGQRLTFIEPICGTVYHEPSAKVGDPSGGSITVMRDELLVSWDDTPPFQGLPTTEVPDPRLIWVAQPATLCPDTAPVLIGVSGQYDPVSPEGVATAVIRSMVIECAPLVVAANGVDVGAADSGHQLIAQADSFAAPGAIDYRSSCDGGTVLTQIQVSAGFWLDGFVLGCSSLRSQSLAGQPCLDGRECQSGACAPEGSCAP